MNSDRKYIVCSHLLNNYSGSPMVLREVIAVFKNQNYDVKLFLGNSYGEGVLSNLDVEYFTSFYRFKENRLLRLIYLLGAEFALFLKVVLHVKKRDCQFIYANTLYSFGVALAGRLKGIRVIYHIHETSLKPEILKRFLRWVVKRASSLNLFVSECHREQECVPGIVDRTIYNCIDRQLFKVAGENSYQVRQPFHVLMACSLKEYKGVYEFLDLARQQESHSNIQFELVLNATVAEIDVFLSGLPRPHNLKVYPSQTDMVPFYSRAGVVLNLSHPELWVETFGLTLLEALSFGVPVIAPEVGGPTELVDDGENGYLISVHDVEKIACKLHELCEDPALCERLSVAARKKAQLFSPQMFDDKMSELING